MAPPDAAKLIEWPGECLPEAIQGLWIGPRLSAMEQLCISSFQRNGHPFHLYVYQPTEGIPNGTTVLDAKEVLPSSAMFTYRDHPTYAGFANFFRYKLLLERGGWFVDLDTVCLRPFDFDRDYVFSSQLRHGQVEVNVAAMKAPPHSEIMRWAWQACRSMDIQSLQWGESGPDLITRAVEHCELSEYVQGPEVFSPVSYPEWFRILDPGTPWASSLRPHAVHLWNEMWRRAGRDKDRRYDRRCLYEQLKRHYLSNENRETQTDAVWLADHKRYWPVKNQTQRAIRRMITAVQSRCFGH